MESKKSSAIYVKSDQNINYIVLQKNDSITTNTKEHTKEQQEQRE